MLTREFDYDLPAELIAQSPALPRESCRLLVVHRATGKLEHKTFTKVLSYLKPHDLLVVNDTKVMPARLLGHKQPGNAAAELLLLRPLAALDTQRTALNSSCTALDAPPPAPDTQHAPTAQHWEALVKPGRRLKPGARISFGSLEALIVDWAEDGSRGKRIVRLETTNKSSVASALHRLGHLPLPPYIKEYHGSSALYQTVYAQQENSAAAPTAGLHFSAELLAAAQEAGVGLARVCLEIGLDTFRTVDEEEINDHHIHTEAYQVGEDTVRAVEQARAQGGRVIAVGTTAVRALESAATQSGTAALSPRERELTNLYITPGYTFKAVDALITNFHTPRSTLMMLVSAFAGHELIMRAYEEAKRQRYRFLSFGDAMLIV